jgi:nucleoside-diphosphate-sugar epimerase
MAAYVVTGCAGFIGSHLVESLLDDGHEVTGLDCFTDLYPRALKTDNLRTVSSHAAFRLVEEDLVDVELSSLLRDADGVFHLAAEVGVRPSWGPSFLGYALSNVVASERVFAAAAARGIRVVVASSSSVYGASAAYPTSEDAPTTPLSPYGVTKLACEHLAQAYARAFGLDVVLLRYFTVYGPRQRPDMAFSRVIECGLRGTGFPLLGSGRQSRDFTYVADAVRATRLAMDRGRPGSVYNVGGGAEASLLKAIALVEAALGRPVGLERADEAPGDAPRTAADIARARDELGWTPRTSLSEGVRAQVEWASGASRLVEATQGSHGWPRSP